MPFRQDNFILPLKMKCHKCDIFYHCFFCVFTLDISISILILDNNLVSKHLTKVFEQKSFSSSELSQLSEPGVSEVSLVCGRGTLSSMDWVPAGPGDLMDLWGNHCHWLATADCTHCTAVHCPVHCVHTHRSRSCRGHIIDTLNIKSKISSYVAIKCLIQTFN